MLPTIPLAPQQKARLSKRPTWCVFCDQPISMDDYRRGAVMLHKVEEGARLCHKTCVGHVGKQTRLLTAVIEDDLPV